MTRDGAMYIHRASINYSQDVHTVITRIEYLLIRTILRYFCLDYFGGKTWPHLLNALVYKTLLFRDIKTEITP